MPRQKTSQVKKQIATARRSLKSLDRSLQKLTAMVGSESSGNSSRRRLSPKGRASLVLQGRYMGFMRQLQPKQKAQVKKIRETRGTRAAIARARQLAAH